MTTAASAELLQLIEKSFPEFKENSIVNGRILEIKPQFVLVDIGYKSEGAIPISEFEDEEIARALNEHYVAIKVDRVTRLGDRVRQRCSALYRYAADHRFAIPQSICQCLNVVKTRLTLQGFDKKPNPATAR